MGELDDVDDGNILIYGINRFDGMFVNDPIHIGLYELQIKEDFCSFHLSYLFLRHILGMS